MKLHIASNFTLPPEAVTQTFAILGIRGSGKTNTGVVMTEELLNAKQQVVVIDPVDVWWGLKSSKTGKGPGFPIPVIGGDHADVPLDGAAGQVLADFVTATRASVILSLRHLSMNDQRKFAGDFAKRLYEGKGQQRSPLMLMVDEADEFVPQRIPHGHEPMFGAFDRLVRRGRSSGIGVTLISQRPQVVNKDVLTSTETLFGMRVIHKLDRKALQEWIEARDPQNRQKEFMDSLASLGLGDAWVWSPSWLKVFTRVHVRERETFDSSATPSAGTSIAPPKRVASLDLDQLREKMSAQIEKAKADDPRVLRARVAELEREIAKKPAAQKAGAKPSADAIEKAAIRGATQIGRRMAKDIGDLIGPLRKLLLTATATLRTLADQLEERTPPQTIDFKALVDFVDLVEPPAPRPNRDVTRRQSPQAQQSQLSDSSGPLPVGERAVLTACAQYPEGATREQVTILTGYKKSTRDTYIKRLSGRGYVLVGNFVVATTMGVAALGPDFEPLPKGAALRAYWLERLPEGERAILEILLTLYPGAATRDWLTERTLYKKSTRDTYLKRLSTRKLVVSVGRAEVKASEVLFE